MTRRALFAPVMLLPLCLSTSAPGGEMDALAERILEAAGTSKGICIDLGCGSGELARAIAGKSRFFVQGLETDPRRVERARRTLEATGEYGTRVAAEKGALSRLPYPDYCANLIVRGDLFAEGARGMSWKEVLRILRPGGLAYLGQSAAAARGGHRLTAAALRRELASAGVEDFEIVRKAGVWVRIRRARPKGAGDWSHDVRCSPANNPCVDDELVKAPFHTLWIAGPRSFTKFGIPLASEGRAFLRFGGITQDSRWKPSKQGDLIQAYDAYNGTLLWQSRLPELAGEGFVALGGKVYAAAGDSLYCIAAEDGKLRWKLAPGSVGPGMKAWAYYACSDGRLVVALFDEDRDPKQAREKRRRKMLAALSPEDGGVLWKTRPEGGLGAIAIGEGLVFFSIPKSLTAVDIATGAERWRKTAAGGGIRYHRGRLYTDGGVFKAADGTFLSRARHRGILVGDRVYGGSLKGISVRDLETGKAVEGLRALRDPYCPKTGVPDGCKWMYGRCIKRTASTHCYFFSYSGTVIGDLLRNEVFPTEAFRSNCRTGVIAGNGLVYNSPSGCGCVFPVRSGVSLLPVDEDSYWARRESDPPARLEKGPAYAQRVTAKSRRDDWPAYRHDPARSGVTDAKLSVPLPQKWTAKLPGRLTPPAVAGGLVLIGSDDHSVYALDAGTGKVRWRHRTGGEIWAAPAYWEGRVYVGSQDGWAYCLRADTGGLIWRFRGSPHERKMIYFGRPRSLWPVSGGVIVDRGVAMFYAGYCSHDRVFVCALDAKTGRTIWVNDESGLAVDVTGPGGGISPFGVSPSGVIAASDEILYVPQGMRTPAAFRRSDGRLLWWNKRGDSRTRSNIEVQHLGGASLSLANGLLFIGGVDRATGSSQPFTVVHAKTGRFWGADDPRLFARAGRDEAGEVVMVEKAKFGTKAIRFGETVAPVAVDGGVFTCGRNGRFYDLDSLLQTQFGKAKGKLTRWQQRLGAKALIVAGDKVVIARAGQLEVVSRADGRSLWRSEFRNRGEVLPDGLAAAAERLYAVTGAGEIVCFGSK